MIMILRNHKNHSQNGGYSLIELLFYIALFAIITIAVINALVTMTRSFRETAIQSELGDSSLIMERMSREIRKASGINAITTNDLQLATTDDNGNSRTVEFHLSGSNAQFYENGVLTGNLNSSSITVTALTFTQITTAQGNAVKILLSLRSNNDSQARVIDFYDTVALRGGY